MCILVLRGSGMIRPVSMAFVLCVSTLGISACQSLPDVPRLADLRSPWGLWSKPEPVKMRQPPQPPPRMDDPPPPAIVPVASSVNDEFMMRLDALDADISKLKRQLAETQRENAK